MSESRGNIEDRIHIFDVEQPLADGIMIHEVQNPTRPERPVQAEGMKPREFVSKLEALSMIKVQAEEDFLQLYVDTGRFKFEGATCIASLRPSPDNLPYGEQLLLLDLKKQLEEAHAPEISRRALLDLTEAVNSKRSVLKEFEGRYKSTAGDDMAKKNNVIAQAMFKRMFSGYEVPTDLHYVETPLSITLLVKDLDELNKLNVAFGGDRAERVAGLALTRSVSLFDVPDNVSLSLQFQAMQSRNPHEVFLDTGIFRHELQHCIDNSAMKAADIDRSMHLNYKEKAVVRSISDGSKSRLKSEIEAYHESNPDESSAIKRILKDPDGNYYNYEGILDRSALERFVEDTIGSEKLSREIFTSAGSKDRFADRDLVDKGIDALDHLKDFYAQRFGDEKFALRFSIAMLDAFPVQDWEKMEKVIKRYSQGN